MNVLLVSHKIKNCGVGQYGIRLKNVLSKSKKINLIYIEVENLNEFQNHVKQTSNLIAIIYNYHGITLPWLSNGLPDFVRNKDYKNIGLLHGSWGDNYFDIHISIDPSESENPPLNYSIPRPIYENVDKLLENHKIASEGVNTFINKYKDSNLPIFGTFGLAAGYKGFVSLIQLINHQYDNAVIKISMPRAHYQDKNIMPSETRRCLNIPRKPGIILLINNEFLSNEDLLLFLKSNTMNVFLYLNSLPYSKNSVSSVIDVVLGVHKPLAVSNSSFFRHVYNDKVCPYKTPIREILKISAAYWDQFRDKYSHKNLIEKFEKIIL